MKKTTVFKIVPLQGQEKYVRLLKDQEDAHRLKSGYVTLQPGQSVGEHSTENKEEILIFLEGEAEVMVEGQAPQVVKGQQAVYIPPHKKHDIRNCGVTPLRYVFTVTLVE